MREGKSVFEGNLSPAKIFGRILALGRNGGKKELYALVSEGRHGTPWRDVSVNFGTTPRGTFSNNGTTKRRFFFSCAGYRVRNSYSFFLTLTRPRTCNKTAISNHLRNQQLR